MAIRFDESLPTLVDFVLNEEGTQALSNSVFIRDSEGKLSVIFDDDLPDDRLERLESEIVSLLGSYAREDGVVRDRNSFGALRLLNEGRVTRPFTVSGLSIAFLDRRTVGSDWLLPPVAPRDVPRIAFASLKGGVGRSTTLAVLAAYLSSRGLRVLAVDLDLEAPGIGTMLVDEEALPPFGTLDYLIENGLSGIDDDFVRNCIGNSYLGATGAKVGVVPAIGSATIQNPAGAIAKLSRAYLEDIDENDQSISLTTQIDEMISRFTRNGEYDVVLIDARAGLHETTAAALLGLGAEMLLFGANEPQTFLGYNLLLSHLSLFKGTEFNSWRERLQFVHAKASGDPEEAADAVAKFEELYSIVYGKKTEIPNDDDLTEDDFDMVWADEDLEILVSDFGDPIVLKVFDDSRYRGFDPLKQRNLLQSDLFAVTFGEVIEWVDSVIPALLEAEDV